jgi:hypothetical protein
LKSELLALHGIKEESTVLQAVLNSNAQDTTQDTLFLEKDQTRILLFTAHVTA